MILRKKKKFNVPEVVGMFKPLYEKIEKLDLHSEKGLHGADEVIGMLETVAADENFAYLAKNSKRRFVLRLGIGTNFNVGEDANFYRYEFSEADGWSETEKDWRKVVQENVVSDRMNLDKVRYGLLDYIRFAPHNDAFGHHLTDEHYKYFSRED